VLDLAPVRDRFIADVRNYIETTTGRTATLWPWPHVQALPLYVQDSYEFLELRLSDHRFLLAVDRHSRQPLANIRAQVAMMCKISSLTAIYVAPTLASFERRRLITQRVPFLIPGNQLFVPELGLDQREHFKARPRTTSDKFLPSTQALLIGAVLTRPWRLELHWRELVVARVFSEMTISRALAQLAALGFARVQRTGRKYSVRFELGPVELWRRAKPYLSSPVRHTFWVKPRGRGVHRKLPLAGRSALAHYTGSNQPHWPVHAISEQHWHAARTAGTERLASPVRGACQWEIWSYQPKLLEPYDAVDRLSLGLTLETDQDPQVQRGLADLQLASEGQSP
jgi:hypothetical protein